MVILTADGPLQNLLQGVKEPAEVRDKNGNILGHYTPVLTPEETAWAEKMKKLFDLEEAERVFQAERDKGRPLQEFWEELKGQKDAS